MAAMASPKKSLYEILGVPRDANDLDIGIAHQRRVAELQRAVPPDPGAQVLLHEAFEVLSNPKRRAAYDASLLSAAEKAAAAQQAEPDLVLEGGEEDNPDRKKMIMVAVAAAVAIVVVIAAVLMRGEKAAPPPPVVEAPKPPPPPPPPQKLSAGLVLARAAKSTGQVMSYEMSGRAVPVSLALTVQPGTMVTTCHGIPGNSQLVVKIGAESNSAMLDVTDEVLDLCRVAITGLNAPALKVAADEARAGDKVYVLGANPKGEMALTEGTVKALRPSPNGKLLELSMPIASAGSGGAVFNEYGDLVGIATTSQKQGAGLNIALPASSLSQMRTRTAQ
jgi:S1-C subfamily serine protease